MYMYVHICLHTYVYEFIYVCMCIYIYRYMHFFKVFIDICMYIYIRENVRHTYIFLYIHSYRWHLKNRSTDVTTSSLIFKFIYIGTYALYRYVTKLIHVRIVVNIFQQRPDLATKVLGDICIFTHIFTLTLMCSNMCICIRCRIFDTHFLAHKHCPSHKHTHTRTQE